jgi:hypothetical protein
MYEIKPRLTGGDYLLLKGYCEILNIRPLFVLQKVNGNDGRMVEGTLTLLKRFLYWASMYSFMGIGG